jgi:hypothetical protein
MDAAGHLSANDHAAILNHLLTVGLASNDGVESVHAAAGSKPAQSGEHFATLSAYGTGGEKRQVRFKLQTIQAAAEAAAARDETAWFSGLMRKLRRIGLSPKADEPIDSVELTKCLRSSGLPVESRMQLRTELFSAGLIEP